MRTTTGTRSGPGLGRRSTPAIVTDLPSLPPVSACRVVAESESKGMTSTRSTGAGGVASATRTARRGVIGASGGEIRDWSASHGRSERRDASSGSPPRNPSHPIANSRGTVGLFATAYNAHVEPGGSMNVTSRSLLAVMTAVVLSAPLGASSRISDDQVQQKQTSIDGIYIVRMAESPVVAYAGGIRACRPRSPRAARRSIRTTRRSSATSPSSTPVDGAALGAVGGRKALRLPLRVQRLRRGAQSGPGRRARTGERGALGRQGYDRLRRYGHYPHLPRPGRPWRPVGPAGRGGQRRRGHHHRRDRLRHLAGEPELQRPHRLERQRHAWTASSPTSRSPAGTASASLARRSTPRCATRS